MYKMMLVQLWNKINVHNIAYNMYQWRDCSVAWM